MNPNPHYYIEYQFSMGMLGMSMWQSIEFESRDEAIKWMNDKKPDCASISLIELILPTAYNADLERKGVEFTFEYPSLETGKCRWCYHDFKKSLHQFRLQRKSHPNITFHRAVRIARTDFV